VLALALLPTPASPPDGPDGHAAVPAEIASVPG
jgi:hypothetical protein